MRPRAPLLAAVLAGAALARGAQGPPAAVPTPAGAAPAATVEEPGRSEPDTGESPAAAGSVHRKPGVSGRPVTVAKAPAYTVIAYEAGKSLTLRRPEGTVLAFPIAKKADVPKTLAPGRSVTIRTRTEGGRRVVTRVRESADTPVHSNVN